MEMMESELPKYVSHKEVWALKIKDMKALSEGAMIYPEDERYAPFMVNKDYVKKHDPKSGGYYVIYEGGYESWSPSKAFEDGYTLKK